VKALVLGEGGAGDPNAFVHRIRLFDPLAAVARRYPLEWSTCTVDDVFDADVIIVQRTPFANRVAVLRAAEGLRDARRRGVRVLWEIDDHIFCDDLRTLIKTSAIDEVDEDAVALVRAHRELFRFASAFVCSTEPLAEAMRRVVRSAGTCVIPVALDFSHPRWRVMAPPRERVTIGWSGGSRVGRDLELLIPVVARVLRKLPRVRFLLAGSPKYARLFAPHSERVDVIDWVPYDEYPALLIRFDVALLPMDDHAYNRCKTGLKVVDYAAMGVPAVCSRIAPFLSVREDVSAFAETVDEWTDAIESLLAMHDDRRDALRTQARLRHDVSFVADAWWRALNGNDD
jgi:Glycosyltransferase